MPTWGAPLVTGFADTCAVGFGAALVGAALVGAALVGAALVGLGAAVVGTGAAAVGVGVGAGDTGEVAGGVCVVDGGVVGSVGCDVTTGPVACVDVPWSTAFAGSLSVHPGSMWLGSLM